MISPAEFQTEIPIVLTATIQPNVTGAAAANPATRLAEYLAVVEFCQQFAPVFFLENSGYPLERHPQFAALNVAKVFRNLKCWMRGWPANLRRQRAG